MKENFTSFVQASHIAAEYTRRIAQPDYTFSPEYLELSAEMCWDALVLFARKSGALDKYKHASLWSTINIHHFEHFVSTRDFKIRSKNDMFNVPQGSFIGFFSSSGRIIHALMATGAGFAAGNKNECIGIGQPVGWENLNLAGGGLNWHFGGGFNREIIHVHYRLFP